MGERYLVDASDKQIGVMFRAPLGQFFSHPVGHDTLQAKDDDTAFVGEPGRVRVLDPVNLEARYLRLAAQGPPGQSLFFLLDQVQADPLQKHERLAQRGDAPYVFLAGGLDQLQLGGAKMKQPFLTNNTPVPNGAYTLWAEKAR